MTERPDPTPPDPTPLTLRLGYRRPYAVGPVLRFLAAHQVPGVDHHDAARHAHTRLVPGEHGPTRVTVRFRADRPGEGDGHVVVELLPADDDDVPSVVSRVRRWLDLDTDPALVGDVLGRDPRLAPLVAARPGLRVPGSVDGVETAMFAVLGQQVSLRAARTFAGRLVAAFGTAGPATPGVALPLAHLGDLAPVVEAGAEGIQRAVGVTSARARTLHALACAVVDGLRLDAEADRAATRSRLLALPGIGPWTADYVALRCLGDPDAYPAGDLVLRRALGVGTARAAEASAERWRPWRGYALLHLWTEQVFA
jgi:3-methyladenine DNA glycosylase/8-oxoguanine DNA glycosylase